MAETRDLLTSLGASPERIDKWTASTGPSASSTQSATVSATLPPSDDTQVDNQLAQVRLGVAGSLYVALKLKHAAAATHSLRVALGGSLWSIAAGVPTEIRDAIEVSALLHDVGMISVPDQILIKSESLTENEAEFVDRARRNASLEILQCSCSDPTILEIIKNVGAWYDGSRPGYQLSGAQIPLGARMIAILEAFDAMTTDHVFRPAISQERAINELFEYADSHFDSQLVEQFAKLQRIDQSALLAEVADRWLHKLDPKTVSSPWQFSGLSAMSSENQASALYQARLLDNMHDAVIFVDAAMRVIQWNHGAERLTGISGSSVLQRLWSPGLLHMRNEKGGLLSAEDCPILCGVKSGAQSHRRLTITNRAERRLAVDGHTIPVVNSDGVSLGSIFILHDVSPETSLEERCENLHEKAIRDPMTQVANRAEFDRCHEMFIQKHQEQGLPCSLIICDIDFFKRVNDNFGHQVGDEVIIALATLLKRFCRTGDLVARYGGEEFVVLCADCDNATAAARAEQIRQAISRLPQPNMNGRSVTASFGVSEIQPGDTAETMLRRADRGLLLAKERGRNTVVQLGSGADDSEEEEPQRRFWWQRATKPDVVLEQHMSTPVPMSVAVEKLRGFVADHNAKILSVDGETVNIEIESKPDALKRNSDRPVTFHAEIIFKEPEFQGADSKSKGDRKSSQTKIHVKLTPRKSRDRRRESTRNHANEVLASFRSYLMAKEIEPEPPPE